MTQIRPNPGPQERFLASQADIAVYGGGGGGGKTFALLMDPLYNVGVPNFEALIFRRVGTQITVSGGLWSSSKKIYPHAGGIGYPGRMEWRWPNGFRVGFRHLEDDAASNDLQGAQIPSIGFDELTHFSRSQFLDMLSRNRSTTGIPGRMRATCNPDSSSWVKEFIRWWLDEEGRWADPAKSGVLRWMVRDGEDLLWYVTKEEAEAEHGPYSALSVTFIPAKLDDNPALTQADPSYLAKLRSLGHVLRQRLELGDWKVRAEAGTVFRREWFQTIPAAPVNLRRIVRYWDRAATEPTKKKPEPDWTVGLKLGRMGDGRFVVLNVVRLRGTPMDVKTAIRNTTLADGQEVEQWLEHDPGQAGKYEASDYLATMAELGLKFSPVPKTSKLTRANAVSSQTQVGNVMIVSAHWNEDFLGELEMFPDGTKDDQVDAFSGAYHKLTAGAWGEPSGGPVAEDIPIRGGEDRVLQF